eukprot:TRINITY_DN65200_c0_g1_i1.p1 TRINITY_DN65200_c0_g1~~TRINITY_DN65200_c0_g1_i1.p1  ORF type:complete len:676 (+),score=186.32 TRINITY_DN65200_c0_g1_i1:97-2028(+)
MERFERIDKLGEGGQGKVYKVRKKDTGEIVVLKMINCSDPTFATLAEREIEVMKACVHPHIIRFEESFRHTGKSGSWVCLVMQYCAGGDLFTKFKNAVQDKRKFEEKQLVSWICQIASGLQYMHEKDLWHRDVKAANVLFDEHGVVKLGDFGLSSSYSPDGHKTVVGTPFYFAPEIMLNQQYTNKVDIWNLGVVMLELMTFKQLPVNVEVLRNDHFQQKIMQSIVKEGYSKKLALIIGSMLGKLPDDRPSAREVLQQLGNEDDGVVDGPCREFNQSEHLLRETLASHPLFAKGAKKASEGRHTHHGHRERDLERERERDREREREKEALKAAAAAVQTPPHNPALPRPKEEPQRKRMTAAEGEIQRLVHTDDDRTSVSYLAGHYDRMSRKSPPPQAQQAQQAQHQWNAVRSPVTPHTREGSAFPTSTSNSERNSGGHVHTTSGTPLTHPGSPFAKHTGSGHHAASPHATDRHVKSPTSPMASPRMQQQQPQQQPHHQQQARRQTAPAIVPGWPHHPRSPIANEGSGGSGSGGSGEHGAGPAHDQHAMSAWGSPKQQVMRGHAPAQQHQYHQSPPQMNAHHNGGHVHSNGGYHTSGSPTQQPFAMHHHPPPRHPQQPPRGLGESDLRHVHNQLQQLHQQQLGLR